VIRLLFLAFSYFLQEVGMDFDNGSLSLENLPLQMEIVEKIEGQKEEMLAAIKKQNEEMLAEIKKVQESMKNLKS